jgi:DNA ligase-associated metallophosphoesterase
VRDEELILHPLKCVYWPGKMRVVCADVHIGKGAHFRKHGIAVPRMTNKNNFWNLAQVFDEYKPKELLVLGDMVHSTENDEWKDFQDFLDNYPSIQRKLVRGNHEICPTEVYTALGFEVMDEWEENDWLFCHEPFEHADPRLFQMCGHIHPALGLSGTGKQHLRVPCFWLEPNRLVLPSFGEFTGSHIIKPKRGDRVFAVSGESVLEVK